MTSSGDVKVCSQCEIEKPLSEFEFKNKITGTRRANCRQCKNESKRKAYEDSRTHPESVARRILKKCKEREKERLARYIRRRDELEILPDVELTPELFNIDLNWIFEQRDKQNNKCWYSGKEMIWSTGYIEDLKRMNPLAITIERLDSNKGYVKENCVLCCWMPNRSKGDGTIEELIDFSLAIVNKNINKVVGKLTNDILNREEESLFVRDDDE